MREECIRFFYHEIKGNIRNKSGIKNWLCNTAAKNHRKIESLDIVFCNDEYLYHINKKFLKHDYYTDIITFGYEEGKKPIIAELYISLDRIKENAKKYKVKVSHEKRRVIIHGLLHLLGNSDDTEEKMKIMKSLENKHLQEFDEIFENSST